MSLLFRLPTILQDSLGEYQKIINAASPEAFSLTELCGGSASEECSNNILAMGDNATFMKYLLEKKNLAAKIDLIYIDPPFFSRADYGAEIKLTSEKEGKIPVMKQKAYHDTWENGMEEYLRMLTPRLLLMKDLLSEKGGIFIHLDWHAAHYVKVLMDEIFGEKNFVNEIIWQYKS
ncbi:MAG: site-specific DNA-methyltransferase, partial [Eubacteriales bacterium]|nr:site-specific DNA-methyltransferase [Eubacteriales bacterium]